MDRWRCRDGLNSEMSDNPFDVMIVLGARHGSDGNAGVAMIRRVSHAIFCYQVGKAAHILMAGGRTSGTIPESRTMVAIAVEGGVPASAVIEEDKSTRTLENAAECKKIMAARGWQTGLLVTDRFHMARALYTFRALGVRVTPDPVTMPLSFSNLLFAIREFGARIAYAGIVWKYRQENP